MKMTRDRVALSLLAVFAALMPSSASAHIVPGEAVGFASGFLHPISGADHIIAMVAVGLWGAQLGKPAIWLLPVTFPLIMAVGGFLGLIGFPLPGSEIAIALSGVCLVPRCYWSCVRRSGPAAALVGVFGLFHGYAHGSELPPGQNALLYSLGFVIATELAACDRHRHRHRASLGLGPDRVARARRRGDVGWSGVLVECRGVKSRLIALLAVALAIPQAAQAHLVVSGMGPVYDGISHFGLSPEDFLPVIAFGFFAGFCGKAQARWSLFALVSSWIVGGCAAMEGVALVPLALRSQRRRSSSLLEVCCRSIVPCRLRGALASPRCWVRCADLAIFRASRRALRISSRSRAWRPVCSWSSRWLCPSRFPCSAYG